MDEVYVLTRGTLELIHDNPPDELDGVLVLHEVNRVDVVHGPDGDEGTIVTLSAEEN